MQEATAAHTGVSPLFLDCHVVFDVRGQGQLKSYTPIQGHLLDCSDVVVTINLPTSVFNLCITPRCSTQRTSKNI